MADERGHILTMCSLHFCQRPFVYLWVRYSLNIKNSSNCSGLFQYFFRGDCVVRYLSVIDLGASSLRFNDMPCRLEWYSGMPRRRWQVSWANMSRSVTLLSRSFWIDESEGSFALLLLRIWLKISEKAADWRDISRVDSESWKLIWHEDVQMAQASSLLFITGTFGLVNNSNQGREPRTWHCRVARKAGQWANVIP